MPRIILPPINEGDFPGLPDGDPRGIDGVADWDSMDMIDDETARSLRAATRHDNESVIFPGRVTAEPGPQQIAHRKMVRLIKALRAELRAESEKSARRGHNRPPSFITEATFNPEQVAALLRATSVLEQARPAPRGVPEQVHEARKTLKHVFTEAFAHAAGAKAGEEFVGEIASLVKFAKRCAVGYLLWQVLEISGVWVELIKSAGH